MAVSGATDRHQLPSGASRAPSRRRSVDAQLRHGCCPRRPVTIAAHDVTTRSNVSENDNTSSGSRWEPGAQQAAPDPAWQPPTVPQQPAGTTPEGTIPAAAAVPRANRGRLAVAAAAVGLVAARGGGGVVGGPSSPGEPHGDGGGAERGG